MADNVELNAGSGGAIAAADDVGGVHYQVIKIDVGADGVSAPLGNSNPIPISDAGGVITVDGTVAVTNAGITSLATLVKAEDSAHSSTDPGIMALAVRQDSQADFGADGDYVPFSIDADGAVRVAITSGAGSGGTSAADDADFTAASTSGTPVMGVYEASPSSVTDGDLGVIGITETRAVRVHIDSITGAQVDDAAFTPATDVVSVIGAFADEAATDSVGEGDAGAVRMTLDRKLIVTNQPHTSGGLSIHRSIDLDEGALEVVKASPGQVYGMWVTNHADSTRYIKFYDATSGTAGTGTPVITIGIPGNATDNIAGNFGPGGMGIAFATGICVGATTGLADNDTGGPTAGDVVVNIFYV